MKPITFHSIPSASLHCYVFFLPSFTCISELLTLSSLLIPLSSLFVYLRMSFPTFHHFNPPPHIFCSHLLPSSLYPSSFTLLLPFPSFLLFPPSSLPLICLPFNQLTSLANPSSLPYPNSPPLPSLPPPSYLHAELITLFSSPQHSHLLPQLLSPAANGRCN